MAGIASVCIAACGSDDTIVSANPGNSTTGDASSSALDDGSLAKSDASSSNGDAARSPDGAVIDCGTRTGMRGLTNRNVMVGGVKRTYLTYLPTSADPKKPLPFVFVFHGYTMSGQQMHDITQYAALADSEGIAVVFPDGLGGADSLAAPWNVDDTGETVCGNVQTESSSGDDFGFMDAMTADVENDQCLDSAHRFATGFSMGGYFSHHLACHRSDIRAVAPHSGGTVGDLSTCTTGHVPTIIFHGVADPLIPDGCDDPNGVAQPSYAASAKLWAAKNGCGSTYTTVTTNGSSGDGQCYVYDSCPADGQVELCTFTAMGHCWAGGSKSGQGATFACPTYADATALEWAFFKKYAW
ncbi:MAG: PHB depolymerase family esterase [Polyangiaceae bacterium]